MVYSKHTIYLVRHGQCKGNVSGEALAPEEDVITDFGRIQADALGEHLKEVHFTKAYSSTYQRAIETAKAILARGKASSTIPLIMDPRIKEREMGALVGVDAKEIVAKAIQKLSEGKRFNEMEVPGAESVSEYTERQRSFFQELFNTLKSSSKPETVLIVSHGLTMRHFLMGLNNGAFPDLCTVTNWDKRCSSLIQNTSCTTFTLDFPQDEEKPVVTFDKIHDRQHLATMEGSECDSSVGDMLKKSLDVSEDQKVQLMELLMKMPGAKEELSGCAQM